MGLAVALLAVYTFVLRAQPSGRSKIAGTTEQLRTSLATKATGQPEAGAEAPAAAPSDTATGTAEAPGTATPAVAAVPDPEVWGSDPFVRDWMLTNELANLYLKAITIGGDGAYALINDQILEEGDIINGKRIVSIQPDNVMLEQGGRTFTLLLGER
ncbi:MAG: hypothetical protein R6X13_04495 [bacterium]